MRSRIVHVVGLGAVVLVGAAVMPSATAAVSHPSPSINHEAAGAIGATGMQAGMNANCYYSQGSFSDGSSVSTQNFEAKLDKYDDVAADDFVVPDTGCTVRTMVVKGSYSGAGDMQTANVTFYRDGGAKPGKVIKVKTSEVTVDQTRTEFTISLGTKGIKLLKGQTWVSVQANLDYDTGGQWYWLSVTDGAGDAGQWRNPGGGFGIRQCRDWCVATKAGVSSPEFLFSLS